MVLTQYQVFENENFKGIRTSYEDETKDGTRQRLIDELGFSKNISLFYFRTLASD